MLKGQWGSAKRLATIATLAAVTLGSAGCTKIETGDVGILKNWSGQVNMEPQTGVTWHILDTLIDEIDTTQTRIQVTGMVPKDSKGVALQDLDVTLIYKLNPSEVPKFYSVTKEIDAYKDESGRYITTMGLYLLKNKMPSIAQKVTERDQLTGIAASTSKYEKDLAAEAQQELNTLYPNVFQIVAVNVNRFALPPSIQEQVDAIAGLQAKQARITQEQLTVQQGQELEKEKATVEANGLRAAMDSSHLTAEQLIAWKQAKAMQTQAENLGNTVRTVDVGSKPALK